MGHPATSYEHVKRCATFRMEFLEVTFNRVAHFIHRVRNQICCLLNSRNTDLLGKKNRLPASQQIPHSLWKTNGWSYVHKSAPPPGADKFSHYFDIIFKVNFNNILTYIFKLPERCLPLIFLK